MTKSLTVTELLQNARNAECRYCERYGRRCGRAHTDRSRKDWGRERRSGNGWIG